MSFHERIILIVIGLALLGWSGMKSCRSSVVEAKVPMENLPSVPSSGKPEPSPD